MTWKLFLDDLRSPPDGTWVVARSVQAAKLYIETYGLPLHMSLDHDLGGDDTPVLLHWLIEGHLDRKWNAQRISVTVHSANIVGSENIDSLWRSFKELPCAT